MERAIYCYNWLAGRNNFHPSHQMKSMPMIEDLEVLKPTMLVWSTMGAGSISLPYLEEDIYSDIAARLRFHGYINDFEFVSECTKRDIKAFAVVYEAQGWEFPAVLNEDGTAFKDLNIIKAESEHDWYGLREFTQDKHWKVFGKKFSDYFPDGLYNSDGEAVTDIWEECTTRNMYGVACQAGWVEVNATEQSCHNMCRNNPVWRTYLKKIIQIQINAGAKAIQLDESEAPITSVSYGGCFCKDCMKQFTEYLKGLKAKGKLPEALAGVNLDTFNYAEYLKERNIIYPGNLLNIPLFDIYWDFMLCAANKHFIELADYIKEYGKSKGENIEVSGNFFNMGLNFVPLVDKVDYCVTELNHTMFKRHNWYRLACGYTKDKPVIIAENPYGGLVPKFVELLNKGKCYDLFRIFLLEASANGCNMAYPYGAWMGNKVKDGFYAPTFLGKELQGFLAENDRLFGKASGANVLVLYGFESYRLRERQISANETLTYEDSDDLLSYSIKKDSACPWSPFEEITGKLSEIGVNYDVTVIKDDDMCVDDFTCKNLQSYDLVIIPDCSIMTLNQADVLKGYANNNKVLIFGNTAENIPGWAESMKTLGNVTYVPKQNSREKSIERFGNVFKPLYNDLWQIRGDNKLTHFQLTKLADSTAIHIINYNYCKSNDKIMPTDLILDLRLGRTDFDVETFTLDGSGARYEIIPGNKDVFRLKLTGLPAYTCIELK
ncbi:MAG TPA: hypothetical protein VIK78_04810 [Ruminiclostridium sp.]